MRVDPCSLQLGDYSKDFHSARSAREWRSVTDNKPSNPETPHRLAKLSRQCKAEKHLYTPHFASRRVRMQQQLEEPVATHGCLEERPRDGEKTARVEEAPVAS